MTTENEREKAQLEATEDDHETELALMVVEVVARDEKGRITQVRGMREASDVVVKAIMDERKGAGRVPPK